MTERRFLPLSLTLTPREKELQEVVALYVHLCVLFCCTLPQDLQLSVWDIETGYTPKDHSDDLLSRLTDLKDASYDRFQKLVGNARDPICIKMMEWYLKKSKRRTALRRQADNRRQAAVAGRHVSRATK